MIPAPSSLQALERDELIALVQRAIDAGAFSGGPVDLMDARRRVVRQKATDLKGAYDRLVLVTEQADRTVRDVGNREGFKGTAYAEVARAARLAHSNSNYAYRRYRRAVRQLQEIDEAIHHIKRNAA